MEGGEGCGDQEGGAGKRARFGDEGELKTLLDTSRSFFSHGNNHPF